MLDTCYYADGTELHIVTETLTNSVPFLKGVDGEDYYFSAEQQNASGGICCYQRCFFFGIQVWCGSLISDAAFLVWRSGWCYIRFVKGGFLPFLPLWSVPVLLGVLTIFDYD